jgi:hypothetical protein
MGSACATETLAKASPAKTAVPNHLNVFIGDLHTTASGAYPREISCKTGARAEAYADQ